MAFAAFARSAHLSRRRPTDHWLVLSCWLVAMAVLGSRSGRRRVFGVRLSVQRSLGGDVLESRLHEFTLVVEAKRFHPFSHGVLQCPVKIEDRYGTQPS